MMEFNDDVNKFMKLIKKYKKVKTQILELEKYNQDNKELQNYIKFNQKLMDIETEIDKARKGYLYESLKDSTETILENKDVKITITLPYEKEDFDKEQFKMDFKDDMEMYSKYIVYKQVKGNIKYKIK